MIFLSFSNLRVSTFAMQHFNVLCVSVKPCAFQRWDIFRRKKSSAGLNLGVPAGVSRRTGLEGSGAEPHPPEAARRRRKFLDFTPVGGPQNASYMS